VTNSTFSGNTAFNGGGIANSGQMTISGSTLGGNSVNNEGGGVFNHGNATLTGLSFANNYAGRYGGGVLNQGTMSVSASDFTGNTSDVGGCGIFNGGQLSVSDSTLTGNKTGRGFLSYGGGVSNQGTMTLTNSTLSGNYATFGGGVSNQGAMTLTNSTLSGNSATFGGGVFNQGTMTLTNSTLSGNSATIDGGGLYNGYSSTLTMSNSTLAGNSAQYGGGVYNHGPMVVTNSTLSGNTAQHSGGGVYIGAMTPFNNSTVGALTLNNSIVGGNTLSDGVTPSDLGGPVGADPGSSHNLIGPGGSGGLVNGVNGNIIVASAAALGLGPLANNGGPTQTMALLPGSPAINAGDNSLAAVVPNNALAAASDPDFATPSLGAGTYAYDPAGSPWTFTGTAGLASNGSLFNNPPAPQGSQVAFLQGSGSISQTFDLAAGTYVLGFLAAQRPGNQQTFEVLVDGAVVAMITPSGSQFALYTTSPFTVTAGAHTIEFVGLNPLGGDNTAFLAGRTPTDQRGLPRISGTAVDIGAYEVQQPSITSTTLPAGTFDTAYSQTVAATEIGYQGAFSYAVTAGTLPPGLSLNSDGTLSGTPTAAGSFSFTVTATDSSGYTGSQTCTLNVAQAIPTVSVSDAGGTYNGSPFAATATVAGVVSGVDNTPAAQLEGVTPTLTYYAGTYNLGSLPASGGSSIAPSAAGSYTVVASFPGSADYSSAQALATYTITAAATATAKVSLSASTAVYGQPVTLTATVTNTQTAITPSGSVAFYDGSTELGTAPVAANGTATLTVATLSVGKHSLTASFSDPAGNFTPSNASAAVSLTIGKASTTTTLTATTNTPVFGQAVTFTATVAAVAPSAATPTGTVTFKDGNTVLATVTLSGGSASFTTAKLALGNHAITAYYSDNPSFVSSNSSPASPVTVSQDGTRAVVTSSVSNPVSGQSVTLTAKVTAASPGSGTPTGMVTFYDGTTALGSATLSNGVASIKTTALSAGSNSITVVYGGNNNFLGTTSAALGLTVNQDRTTTKLTSSTSTAVHGSAVTLTATVLPVAPGSGTPTQTVSFWDGSVLLGTVGLSNGVATLSYLFSLPGTYKIKAVYNGDPDFLSSTSSVLTETIS
jgi:hypothetical protein